MSLDSIYIGMSGLNAFNQALNTISNNVANIDTNGFKETLSQFDDVYDYGGSGYEYFSNNSQDQNGNGVTLAPSQLDFSQGTLQQTGNPLDLAIKGSGFFVLQNPDGNILYTQTGSFSVDSSGYIVLSGTTDRLCTISANGDATPVNIQSLETNQPVATTTVTFANNLSSSATSDTVSNIDVYDSSGTEHVWSAAFAPSSDGVTGDWDVTVTDSTGTTIGKQTLKFSGSTPDPTADQLTFTSSPTNAQPLSVVFDFSNGVTSYSGGSTSTLSVASSDGNALGNLSTVTVDDTGTIQIAYDNSKTAAGGTIAVADFREPQKLTQLGQGLFDNNNGGQMEIVKSGTSGVGNVESGQIEASNVNLSNEFGDLIIIQRGYQAASEIVSVSNDMLQELFGLRGRG